MFGEAVSGIGGVVAGEAGPDAADAAVLVREGEGDLRLWLQPEGTSESCTSGGAVSMPDTVKLCRVWLPA